ncbi:MAG: serine hydrolase [Caldilineaceae bacterium]
MRRSFPSRFNPKNLLFAITVLTALLSSGCQPLHPPSAMAAHINYDITQGWQLAAPAEHGVSTDALAALAQAIENEYPAIDSTLIVKNGYIIFEQYRPGSDEHTYHELYSVTKSVTSLLVGIAIDRGLIESTAQPIAHLFGEPDPGAWRAVTIEELLTMSAGFDNAVTFGNMDHCLMSTDDWRGCLAGVVRNAPETNQFLYTESGAHLLSIILTEKSGQSELEFANENLFGPLGIVPGYWDADFHGHNWGSSTLSLIPRDMAKLGQLVLNQGRWGEQQIVSANWVAQATQKHSDGGFPLGVAYGYLWWLPTVAEYSTYAAFGSGGQFILIIPQLDAVVVITADVNNTNPYLLPMIEQYVIPALANKPAISASP